MLMRFESDLCHASENKFVVKVIAWHDDKNLGSALAEGTSVEQAEDKAISRLNRRLYITSNEETTIKSNTENIIKKGVNIELPNSETLDNNPVKKEPSDWSNELIEIDSEIERLNWSRDDEISFLEKNLGYNNRNKITNYNELLNYLNLLKKIEILTISKDDNEHIKTLIEESNTILKDLNWDYKQGREYLQKEFNVSTRKELDEIQLLSFVSKLRSIRNKSRSS